MLALSAPLQSHLASGSTTLCNCWRLIRADGIVFGFTDHDRDLTFGGTAYLAATGLSSTETETSLGLAVSGGDISGALTSTALTESDIIAGRYDGATIETWLVNWQDVTQRVLLEASTIGEIRRTDNAFTAELRSAAAAYDEEKGRLYSPRCDAEFGDARCGVSLAAPDRRANAVIAAAGGKAALSFASVPAIAAGALTEGRIRFLSGASQGLVAAITSHQRSGNIDTIALDRAMEAGFGVPDSIELTIGCDKRFATCSAKFSNTLNFRGFPHVPTTDAAFGYAERGRGRNDGGSLFN